MICSLAHLKISRKSVWKFLRKVANRQTDKQTDKQRRKHILLDGGKYQCSVIDEQTPTLVKYCQCDIMTYWYMCILW